MVERLKRVLVVFSTMSGCTATIARRVGVDLIAYGLAPVVKSVEDVAELEPGRFDAVIFGSGVRMGKWHKEARDWLTRNEQEISRVPLALFSVGLKGVTGRGEVNEAQAATDLEHVMQGSQLPHPVSSVVLPGWKRTEGFNTVEKIALRVYPLEDGDYRDWDRVDAWVRQVGPVLTDALGVPGTPLDER